MGKYIDLTGQRFGQLTVIRKVDNVGKPTKWLCKCDCGNIKEVYAGNLKSGGTRSCGCFQKEATTKASRWKGSSRSRLYTVWRNMYNRCYSPKSRDYKYYGARGITVCKEWKNFFSFQKWALDNGYNSEAPRGACTLDRINSDGNYCPENCRWVDMKQQNNKSDNHIIEYNGESHTIAEWSEIVGIDSNVIKHRINAQGWSVERALTTPVREYQHK